MTKRDAVNLTIALSWFHDQQEAINSIDMSKAYLYITTKGVVLTDGNTSVEIPEFETMVVQVIDSEGNEQVFS